MAQAAKEMLKSSQIELEEAMRQAKRYLDSHKPSTRIINQRIQRIRDKEDEFKRYHFVYYEKSSEGVESDEAMKVLRDTLDTSMDTIDECNVFIEDKEEKQRQEEDDSASTTRTQEEEQMSNALYLKQVTEVSIDERVAKDFIQNVNLLVAKNEFTKANYILIKTHLEGLEDVLSALNPSWKALLDMDIDAPTRTKLAEDIIKVKTSIQGALSSGVVFSEQCLEATRPVEASPISTSDSTAVTAESSTRKSFDKIKPEKMSYPTFSGNIRTFSNFKKDFTKIVVPFYSDEFQRASS